LLRQRPAAGGHRVEEVPRARARGVRLEPDALQAANPGVVLVQRAAHRLERHGQPSRSLTADWERFFEWKCIEREDDLRRVSLEVMIRGTCDRARLLDLVENLTLFSEHQAGLVRLIGQNHQFLGVNNAIVSMLDARKSGPGLGGMFWPEGRPLDTVPRD
jgi:hypothetical protein